MHVIIKEGEALLSTGNVSGQFLLSKMNCEEKHVKMDRSHWIGLPLASVFLLIYFMWLVDMIKIE